jgi:hypothetical protein
MVHKKLKVPHIWNYLEPKNEKGVRDGVGIFIKRALQNNEMKFTITSLIRDVKSIVEWCSSVMGEGKRSCEDQSHRKGHVHRYFWEVVDVYRS